MPKFTFTTSDPEGVVRNDEPLEFRDAKAACDEAQVALLEMAQDHLPDGTHAEFFTRVEDEAGTEIYRASLNFRGENAEQIKQADRDAEAAAAEIASLVGPVR